MADDFSSIPVDDLLQQLRDTPTTFVVKSQDAPPPLPPVSAEPVKEEELGEYIIKKTTTLVEQTMGAFKEIKDLAVATNDADTISALAELIKATNSTLDSLNKIHIQNKKTKAAKEIAQINLEARAKELQNSNQPANILAIGTREEVLKMLAEASRKSVVVEAEFTDVQTSAVVPLSTQ